jgi:hypothetical protein
MRLTKNEKHKNFATKYVKKFAILPKFVQQQWIWLEYYYVGFDWRTTDFDTLQDKIGFSRSIENYKYQNHRYDSDYITDEGLYDKSTHSWVEFKHSSRKLPEDPEVQKWLVDNSPLNKALKE